MLSVTDTQRKRRAAVLTLLWGLYALLGASGLGQSASARTATRPASSSRVAARAPACHCAMCRGMMQGGRMKCCCCKANLPPTQRAVLCARCDQGAPAVLAAVTSWPVTVPDGAVAATPSLVVTLSHRPGPQSAPSAALLPPTPPPCLL